MKRETFNDLTQLREALEINQEIGYRLEGIDLPGSYKCDVESTKIWIFIWPVQETAKAVRELRKALSKTFNLQKWRRRAAVGGGDLWWWTSVTSPQEMTPRKLLVNIANHSASLPKSCRLVEKNEMTKSYQIVCEGA